MSTALVSSFYDYSNSNVMYKNSNYSAHRSSLSALERKSPVTAVTLSHTPVQRRSSTSSASILRASSPTSCLQIKTSSPAVMTVNTNNANNNNTSVYSSSNSPGSREHRKLDRSLSEPVERSGSQNRPAQTNSSRYKTELCRPFEENGTCKYGDKCQFAHGAHELRTLARHPKYKTELCRTFHTTGFCPYGPRCHFIHNSEESRKNLMNNLQSTNGSSGGGSNNGNQVNGHSPQARPKALSLGSFSLGSAGELSPPSSPTIYDDPFINFPNTPQTPSANTAFSFSQDFATLVNSPPPLPLQNFGGSQPALSPFTAITLASVCGNDTSAFQFPARVEGPPSPVDSLSSELDTMSIGGSPAPASGNNTGCNSPLSRLPIFNQLAHGDSD